ncbi:Epoxide hydrolase 3 [Linnemannia gamsii]|uniref:Epoxide hydrolase 3 n=1 Tax=Linnemannia gamsii TaxID=64522 RepID=A0ABQ7K6U5_9FUNG|nr:Epoxide hydrolase 3 [Linnemannia gamsii]
MCTMNCSSHQNVVASFSLPQKDYVEEGNSTDPVILLIHGFPGLWYSWRHQIKSFADKGSRVIVIDCLGYGETVGSSFHNSVCTPGLPFVDYPVPVKMTVEVFPTLRYLLFYTDPDPVPLVNSNELDYLTGQFEKTGFGGSLNYYKTGLINYT